VEIVASLLLNAQNGFKRTICALYSLEMMFLMYTIDVMPVRQQIPCQWVKRANVS